MKPITVIHQVILNEVPDLDLEPTQRTCHLSPRTSGVVHGLTGVATSDLDIVITNAVTKDVDPRDCIVLEVSRKAGKYDGRERDRLTLRVLPRHHVRSSPEAELSVQYVGSECIVSVLSDTKELWSARYRAWTHEITDPTHAGDIVRWHYRRYYSFLSEADVVSLEAGFADACTGMTLAQANRLASRELYNIARMAGYRKLTLREQKCWGLEGQWHKDSVVATARGLIKGDKSGCGERTLMASSMSAHIEEWMDRI